MHGHSEKVIWTQHTYQKGDLADDQKNEFQLKRTALLLTPTWS
jgi:hypothetical protein